LGKLLKEVSRIGFTALEMDGFQDQAHAAVWRGEADPGGDHSTITVAPEDGTLDGQGVQNEKSFFGSALMKITRHWAGNSLREAMARTTGDYKADAICESLDLMSDGITFITPATVQKNERRAAADVAIVDSYRMNSGSVGGVWYFDEGHICCATGTEGITFMQR